MAETHSQLCEIVERSEPRLRDLWARRLDDRDILVLADLRRDERCRRFAREWWPEPAVRDALAGPCPFLPYLQPARLLDVLKRGEGGRAQAEAAKELAAHAAAGLVPLWVVTRTGHWATGWAPPGSRMVVIRYGPEPAPDRN
jgi:hypothetical protein